MGDGKVRLTLPRSKRTEREFMFTLTRIDFISQPDALRFWSKVTKDVPPPAHCPDNGNCWIWSGTINNDYGVFKIRRHLPKPIMVKAHRVSWAIVNGDCPSNQLVLHRCDRPLCVNPDHLFLGTVADNIADRVRKNRTAAGERQHLSKLNDDKVHEILTLLRDHAGETVHGRGIARRLAERFGVTAANIRSIGRRETWKHVMSDPVFIDQSHSHPETFCAGKE